MKNTTRHKISLNPARGLGEHCELPQQGPGQNPGALALFMFFEGKIQHLINIPAPNLLTFSSSFLIKLATIGCFSFIAKC